MKFLCLQQHGGYGGVLSKICQRNTNTVWYYWLWKLKKYSKSVNVTKSKQTHRYREQTSAYKWGEGGEEGRDRGRDRWLRHTNYYA